MDPQIIPPQASYQGCTARVEQEFPHDGGFPVSQCLQHTNLGTLFLHHTVHCGHTYQGGYQEEEHRKNICDSVHNSGILLKECIADIGIPAKHIGIRLFQVCNLLAGTGNFPLCIGNLLLKFLVSFVVFFPAVLQLTPSLFQLSPGVLQLAAVLLQTATSICQISPGRIQFLPGIGNLLLSPGHLLPGTGKLLISCQQLFCPILELHISLVQLGLCTGKLGVTRLDLGTFPVQVGFGFLGIQNCLGCVQFLEKSLCGVQCRIQHSHVHCQLQLIQLCLDVFLGLVKLHLGCLNPG